MSKKFADDEGYAFTVRPDLVFSIRGLEEMLKGCERAYGKLPVGLCLTHDQFERLCIEAQRKGQVFADLASGRRPHFRGMPIELLDAGERDEFEALLFPAATIWRNYDD